MVPRTSARLGRVVRTAIRGGRMQSRSAHTSRGGGVGMSGSFQVAQISEGEQRPPLLARLAGRVAWFDGRAGVERVGAVAAPAAARLRLLDPQPSHGLLLGGGGRPVGVEVLA